MAALKVKQSFWYSLGCFLYMLTSSTSTDVTEP